MRKLLFLLIIFSLSNALSSPPIEEITINNDNLEMHSISVPKDVAKDGVHPDNLVSGSFSLIGISPSIDSSISSSRENKLFWSAKFTFRDLVPGFCGPTYDSHVIFYDLSFDFRNISKIVSKSNSTNNLASSVEIPISKEELNLVEANDSLRVQLNWTNHITYQNWVTTCNGFTCFCTRSGNVGTTLKGSESLEFEVLGGPQVYFLSKPVLKEQWFENNKFNTIIIANNKFYSGVVKLDGEKLQSVDLYEFKINNHSSGFQSINSTYLNDSNSKEYKTYTIPSQINVDNRSFSYVYEFNSSYEGIGPHMLSLEIEDFFKNKFEYNELILSRAITFDGNNSELGEITYDPKSFRKSFDGEESSLLSIVIPSSIIGVLLILILYKSRF